MNIGVFDSGIGGKLIANKIARALPKHQVIFKADHDYFPYGNKPSQFIIKRLILFTQKFIKLSCKIIVIACNTATTNAINQLRQRFPRIIFVGIEPPIKPIGALTSTYKIAIMGTPATLRSARQTYLKQQFGSKVKLYEIACPGLAEAIEDNPRPTTKTRRLLKKFLDLSIKAGVDTVGISCTHYPYLLKQMQQIYPKVLFYDPADAVVRRVVSLVAGRQV